MWITNLARAPAGLSWETIGNKWPSFKKAFANFAIDEVAKFDEGNVSQLMSNTGIVRNERKIEATISDAKEFQRIRSQWGSFQSYLSGLDKSQRYSHVIKELRARFHHFGSSSARTFLYSVGENEDHQEGDRGLKDGC